MPPGPTAAAHRPSACAAALDAIASARRPVILAGHGVLIAGASRLLREFAERGSIPGRDDAARHRRHARRRHPLNLGMLGMHGEAYVNQAVQGADLIIAIGMRFDDRAVGRVADFAPNARRIHMDIDAAEINKTVRADVADRRGRRGGRCEILLRDLPATERRTGWAGSHAMRAARAGARDILNLPDDGGLHAAHVMRELMAGNARARGRRHGRRPAPDVGSAVSPARDGRDR